MLSYQFLILFFFFVMIISIFAYIVLDGYDLGVGLLLPFSNESEQDLILSSIAPFWDANETWLVLGIGVLLVAFPIAHGIILSSLYLPVLFMLFSLIIRGCSFDFRLKSNNKKLWTSLFFLGSLGASLSQGFILGFWLMSFQNSFFSYLFSFFISILLPFAYTLIGSNWLLMKMNNLFRIKILSWYKNSLVLTSLAIFLISIVTPLVSNRIFSIWFSYPNILYLSIIPVITSSLILFKFLNIKKLSNHIINNQPVQNIWIPFITTLLIFFLCLLGLLFSVFPYIIIEQLTIWNSSTSQESLLIIFYGVIVVFPIIIIYTIFSYKIFHGESKNLEY